MATLGAGLLNPLVIPLTTQEVVNLPSYRLLSHAFMFQHAYLPDDDIAVFVNFVSNTLKVSPDIAVSLVFIIFGVSELKFRTESGKGMNDMSDMCRYIHNRLPGMLQPLKNIPANRFWVRPTEADTSAHDLVLSQVDPAKAVFYALTRFKVAGTQVNEHIGKMEFCEVYKVPATLAAETLPQAPTLKDISCAVGWGLISLWLMGDSDCPQQPYWFSNVFREVLAKNMQEKLKNVPGLEDGNIFPPTFFTEVAANLPLLVEGASSLKDGIRMGGLGRRSRSHTPTGDGSLRPGTPLRDGFITPGDEGEQPEARAIRALENFIVSAKSRFNAWNATPPNLQEHIKSLAQNEFALGCDYIPFD